jgi:hypothetical protein
LDPNGLRSDGPLGTGIASGRSRVVLAVDRLPATLRNRLDPTHSAIVVPHTRGVYGRKPDFPGIIVGVGEFALTEKSDQRAADRDEVLKRMLKMPPKPHKPSTKPKPGSRGAKAERRPSPK